MDGVTLTLLAFSFIIFFGIFAQFVFRKLSIPDVLFLIALGFGLGPYGLGFVDAASLAGIGGVFTTFTLIFLLFDGAFNINLSSLIKEFSESFLLMGFNFVLSSAIITVIMMVANFPFLTSLLTGFLLGGISSSFVIPILKQIKISDRVYSLLTLESALTDVFCIVFSLAVIEIIHLGTVGIGSTFAQLAALFAVATLMGLVASAVWIMLVTRVFKEHNYMVMIAFILGLYVLTEFLQGNGAIAALVFGIVLNNSRQITTVVGKVAGKRKSKKKVESVVTHSEQYFYHQLSFLLKTFFFVYIGVLIDLSDQRALLIGGVISVLLLFARNASSLLTTRMDKSYRVLVNTMFARGLAAAAIAQTALGLGLMHAEFIAKVAYVVITGTIVLSSLRIFFAKRRYFGEEA